jgi:hypothetical protein
VPQSQPAGPLAVNVDFDSGPLAGPLHASTTVNIGDPIK